MACNGHFTLLNRSRCVILVVTGNIQFAVNIVIPWHLHRLLCMVGHLFQNYDTIYVRFFPTYTCNQSCYTIYVRFFATYTCVLSYKRAYICAQKSSYICVTNKNVTETRRIRGTELYRQQKTPSCTMELRSNFRLNQPWPQWPG